MPVTSGEWHPSGSFCVAEPSNVVVTVVKKAFDDDVLVIRCFETHGRRTEAHLRLPHLGAEGTFVIGPYQLKTLAVYREGARLRFREISAVEWELARP